MTMSELIIEGICASGKTTIYKGLWEREAYAEKQSKIQLSEHLTERIIENLKPSVEERVNLLDGYVQIFEKIYSNFYNSRFKDTQSSSIKPSFLLERFHFTHAVEALSFQAFRDIDNRLKDIDFKLVILTMDREVIKDRIEDTFSRRPDTWRKYVMSFGGLEGATLKYLNMQQKLLEYAELTSLPVKIINTSKGNWQEYIDEIEGFWGIE